MQQLTVFLHLSPVLCLLVENLAKLAVVIALSFAQQAHDVQQMLGMKMVAYHFAIIRYIHHIERMQQILVVDVNGIVLVLQNIYHSWLCHRRFAHYRIHAKRSMLYVGMLLYVCQQVKTELIKTEIHDIDTSVHILHVNHFLLQSAQLVAAVFKVALFGCRQKVVVASGCEHSGLHTAFHTTFQLDIIIKFDVRPIVHQLYHFVF